MILKKSDPASIDTTADILCRGGIVILPTDTVYGFSGLVDIKANSKQFETDSKIRAIKGREENKPLTVPHTGPTCQSIQMMKFHQVCFQNGLVPLQS